MMYGAYNVKQEDIPVMYSISFHRSSVKIVGTIFLIRITYLNLKKKSSLSFVWVWNLDCRSKERT